MLFNSYAFLFLFLPVVWGGFFALARLSQAASAAWMAAVSVLFYASWDSAYLYLLLGSIVTNHGFGLWMLRLRDRHADAAVADRGERAGAVAQPVHGVRRTAQGRADAFTQGFVVFDQQHAHAGSVGGRVSDWQVPRAPA